MGNPYSEVAKNNESVGNIMKRIWHCYDEIEDPNALQLWNEDCCRVSCRVMDFTINQRSGGDMWYSDLLASCREGNMTEDDYRFLHGLPTVQCGSWLSRQNTSQCGNEMCQAFGTNTAKLRRESASVWLNTIHSSANQYECMQCKKERKRRRNMISECC